ncbi:hypothetical protein CUMW_213060, partial [Citrus unshiu]
MCYARSSIRSTIDRYKKARSDNSNSGTVTEINAQEVELENDSVCLRSKSCYYRGWRLCLLSPEQEDTLSR